MTVRGYVRVSTGFQATEGFSLPAQKAKIHAWANYAGLSDVEIYEDAGISGTRDDRPGLTALLLDLQPGDTVVTYALSRLARGGAVQLLGIVRDIRAREARVVFLQENIDTETSTGRLMLTILAALAELEIEQTRERTAMGRDQAAREGYWPHNPASLPIGYTTNDEGRIVEDEGHAGTVRWIFAQGRQPFLATAKALNTQGVPTRRGGGQWEVFQVQRIVTNPAYAAGHIIWRQFSHPDDTSAHVPVPAPPLVSREDWQAAQRDRSHNAAYKRPDLFPLTGHLRCGCGAKLHGRSAHTTKTRQGYDQYVCTERVRKTPTCATNGKKLRTYAAHHLHPAARETLAALLIAPDDPMHAQASMHGQEATPDTFEPERQELQQKLDKLLDLYLEGIITRQDYDARRRTITTRLTELNPLPAPLLPPMPAAPDLAANVLHSTNEELAELLDLLEVEFMVTGKNTVQVSAYRPLLDG